MEQAVASNTMADILQKEYWSYEDICRIYGKVSRDTFNRFRHRHKIDCCTHPMNMRAILYNSQQIRELFETGNIN